MMQAPTVASSSRVPAHLRRIGVDAARHAFQPQDVHREEREIEADEKNPEIHLAQGFVHHSAGELREPIVESAEKRKQRATNEDVMEMRDDKECIVHLQIERNGRQHDARKAAHHENEDESEHEVHRGV